MNWTYNIIISFRFRKFKFSHYFPRIQIDANRCCPSSFVRSFVRSFVCSSLWRHIKTRQKRARACVNNICKHLNNEHSRTPNTLPNIKCIYGIIRQRRQRQRRQRRTCGWELVRTTCAFVSNV